MNVRNETLRRFLTGCAAAVVAACFGSGCGGKDVVSIEPSDAATDASRLPGPDAPDSSDTPDSSGADLIDGVGSDDPCSNGVHTIGPLTGSASADLAGIGTRGWDLPGNARVSDDLFAQIAAMISDEESHYLIVSDFAFGVPETASIKGITLEIERNSLSDAGIVDNHVKLLVSGSVVGQDRAAGGVWTKAETVASYGGPSDLWGTTLTPQLVNAANFGAALSVRYGNFAGNDWPHVDRMRVAVHYVCP